MKICLLRPILLLCCLSTARSGPTCLEAFLDKCGCSGLVSVFYENRRNRTLFSGIVQADGLNEETALSSILKVVGSKGDWLIADVVPLNIAVPITPSEQRKDTFRSLIIAIIYDFKSLDHCLRVIKSRRIFGPNTRLLLVTDNGKTYQTLKNTWKIMKSAYLFTIKSLDTDTIQVLKPFSNEMTSVQCADFKELQPLSPKPGWTTNTFRAFITPEGPPLVIGTDDGLCFRMSKAIADSLYMKLVPIFPKKSDDPFEHYGVRGEFVGFKGMLDGHRADLLCGYQSLTPIDWGVQEPLPSYYKDQFVWVLPKRPYIEGWRNLVSEFDLTVWGCLVSAWVSSSLILWLSSAHPQRQLFAVFLETFYVFIGGSISSIQKIFQSFTWVLFLSSIVFTASYQSGLISYLTIPRREPQYKTDVEAAEAGIKAFAHYSLERGFFGFLSHPDHPKALKDLLLPYRHGFYSTPPEGIRLAVNNTGMALFSTMQAAITFDRYFLDQAGNPQADLLDDKSINLIMSAAPAHPYTDLMARDVWYMKEAGLITHWLDDIMHMTKVKYLNNRSAFSKPNNAIALGALGHFFMLFLCLLFVSMCVFFGELAWKARFKKMSRFRKPKNYFARNLKYTPTATFTTPQISRLS